jgi:MFS family permease
MTADSIETSTIRKVSWRLLPFLTVGYFLASLDRVNVGFAALQMKSDIGLSAAAFGFGAGLFFVSYCVFAVPCNMMMVRIGARRWLSFVLIAWGIVSTCMAFVTGPYSFYSLRFLLGIAEAGFFPGVIYYFTLWFPANHRGRVVAILMMALPVSSVLGSPMSAALLLTDGWLGLRGWHWLFIVEGLPAILMGLACGVVLPRSIRSARFLQPAEQDWLEIQVAAPSQGASMSAGLTFWRVLFNKYVLLLTLVYIGGTSVTNGLSLWQPQIIDTFKLTTMQIGLLNAVPFALASLAMYLWSVRSDRSGERILHTAVPLAVGAVALTGIMFVHALIPTILVLCVAISAASMIKGPFWALATEMLPAGSAALAIGQINALNNLGVFVGTYLIGVIRTATGSFTYALVPYLIISVAACLAVLLIGRMRKASSPDALPSSKARLVG